MHLSEDVDALAKQLWTGSRQSALAVLVVSTVRLSRQAGFDSIGKSTQAIQLVGNGTQAVRPEGDIGDVHRHDGARQSDAADFV